MNVTYNFVNCSHFFDFYRATYCMQTRYIYAIVTLSVPPLLTLCISSCIPCCLLTVVIWCTFIPGEAWFCRSYFVPCRGRANYCDERVCVSVCPLTCLNKNSSGDEIANVNFSRHYAVQGHSWSPIFGTNRKLIYDFLLVNSNLLLSCTVSEI